MGRQLIVALPIDVTTYEEVIGTIASWSHLKQGRMVCAANVHVVMEAANSISYRTAVKHADLITPDGMPLVWALRLCGWSKATRVYGPDLMIRSLEHAEVNRIPIGLYGAAPETLDRLVAEIERRFPRLEIAYKESPPFRELSSEEEDRVIERMNASGARLLFVGLGCPKQEYWMARHRDRVHLVLVGVGAAFDFIARTKRQAPRWIQASGLEWAFRLGTEPRRLWRRYLTHNPRFVISLLSQLLHERHLPRPRAGSGDPTRSGGRSCDRS